MTVIDKPISTITESKIEQVSETTKIEEIFVSEDKRSSSLQSKVLISHQKLLETIGEPHDKEVTDIHTSPEKETISEKSLSPKLDKDSFDESDKTDQDSLIVTTMTVLSKHSIDHRHRTNNEKDEQLLNFTASNLNDSFTSTSNQENILDVSFISKSNDRDSISNRSLIDSSPEPDSIEDRKCESSNSTDSLETLPAKFASFAKEDSLQDSRPHSPKSSSISYFVNFQPNISNEDSKISVKKGSKIRANGNPLLEKHSSPKINKQHKLNNILKVAEQKLTEEGNRKSLSKSSEKPVFNEKEKNKISKLSKDELKSAGQSSIKRNVLLHKEDKLTKNVIKSKNVDIFKKDAPKFNIKETKKGKPSKETENILNLKQNLPLKQHGYMQSTLSRDIKLGKSINLNELRSQNQKPKQIEKFSRSTTPQFTEETQKLFKTKTLEKVPRKFKETQKQSVKTANVNENEKISKTLKSKSIAITRTTEISASKESFPNKKVFESDKRKTESSEIRNHQEISKKVILKSELIKNKDNKKVDINKTITKNFNLNKTQKSMENLSMRKQKDKTEKCKSDKYIRTKIPSSTSKENSQSNSKTQSKADYKKGLFPNQKPKSTFEPIKVTKKEKEVHNIQLQQFKKDTKKVIPKSALNGKRSQSTVQQSFRSPAKTHKSEFIKTPSSLPSSPGRSSSSHHAEQESQPNLKTSSTLATTLENGTKLLTSEVFTRTVDSSKSIEVIYRQPLGTSELIRKASEYKYNDFDVNFMDTTTDSSLSDSIALPSSSSDHDGGRKRSGSPASPKPTKRPLQLIEERMKKSDTFLKTESDSDVTHSTSLQNKNVSIKPTTSISQIQISNDEIASKLESRLSPMLDFQTISPTRRKHKFEYSFVSQTEEITDAKKTEFFDDIKKSPSSQIEEPGIQTVSTDIDNVPKPTPRLSISATSSDVAQKSGETISQSSISDVNVEITAITNTESKADEDVDFKQSKKFWESLESSSQSETQPPIPKPRYQLKSTVSDTSQKGDDSIGSAKSSSLSKISSEQQVEYSETSSVRTSLKEDDSEMSDVKMEEEIAPVQKHEDEIERKKETEIIKEISQEDEQVGFYIGESSSNIITKSTTEKRQEYAFDNEGYEDTLDEDRDIEELDYDDDRKTVSKSEVLGESTDRKSNDDSVFTNNITKHSEQISDVTKECEIVELEDLERRKSEAKVTRQPSETRNDILECEFDVAKPSEKQTKSMEIHTAKEVKIEEYSGKEYVIHNVYYEDQTFPVLQESIRQEIPTHVSEVLESQICAFDQEDIKSQKQTYDTEKIIKDGHETFIQSKQPVSKMLDHLQEVKQNEIKLENLSEIKVETDTEKTANRDQIDKELLEQDNKFLYEKKKETLKDIKQEKIESKSKIEPKFELNLEKSETELSEKRFAKAILKEEEAFSTQESKDDYKKAFILDPSQVDQSMVEQTLAEVKESLDAVQEELIEVVKDGKLIKQSPSEFEFKILPNIRYAINDSIQESLQEETSSEFKSSDKQEKQEIIDETCEGEAIEANRIDDYASLSSIEDNSIKLEAVHEIRKQDQLDPKKRWSVPDPEESSSGDTYYQSFEKSDSRPLSSDIENLISCGGSSEYQTAQDASLLPESTEYVSAVSTMDSSGKTISSQESMKSLDSESSINLGSIEVSEISETLVPSTADADIIAELQDEELDSDNEKYCGILMEDFPTTNELIQSQMKRSQEMTFKQDVFEQSRTTESSEITEDKDDFTTERKLSTNIEDSRFCEESKFATSLEEGSILSMSLSSTSCIDTVVENIDDLASSLGASSLTGQDIQNIVRDDFTGTSFDEPSSLEKIDSMVMTSSLGKDEDTYYANTQITTVTTSSTEALESEPKRIKRHKRTESAAFSTSDFLKEIEASKTISGSGSGSGCESPTEEENIPEIPTKFIEEKKESESESDYDAYESEYARAYKTPTTQKKSKNKHTEIFEIDPEPEKRPFTPSQSVSEIIAEDAAEEIESLEIEEERRPSQNMQDYSNVPNITITEEKQKQESSPEDENFREKVLYKVKTQEELHKAEDAPIYYAQEQEYSVSEDHYQDLIQRQFDTKMADITTRYGVEDDEEKADSPDSFEMLEQPDISDEFVIIEEVAKEANEFDTEGKSINISNIKYVKKHDEEVEKILVKSAPADPNQGSAMFMRDDINFDFEESPPIAPEQESGEVTDAVAANKKWIEMQLADNASHLKYPYEMERGILEDIKEEDTDFEVGSSRISSFKDSSFSSSTPEYDVLAARKYFTREHDDISMSSLQEFESLEQAISLENRKTRQGSQDSLSNGSFTKRYIARHSGGQGDDVSLSSLKEFEGLENACIEAHLIEIKAKEEAALLLSRSDESNKSSNEEEKDGNGEKPTIITTKVTTVRTTTVGIPSTSESKATASMSQREIETLIKTKLEECEEESSNIMEVSSDSLELALKKSKSTNGSDKKGSPHGSCDSLEINKSVDIMTSSIDSFEMSKDATGRSSRSDADSLEQQMLQDVRRDSVDSIEFEQALQIAKADSDISSNIHKKDQKIITTVTTTTVAQSQGVISSSTTTITTTSTMLTSSSIQQQQQQQSSLQQHKEMTKDISSDSLNLPRTDPEQLITSTESLDLHTSSTATNATYQNENDSLMSSSITSCGSSTMIETLDANSAEMFRGQSSLMMYDDSDNKIKLTTTQFSNQQLNKDGEKQTDYFEFFENDPKNSDKIKSKTGEEAPTKPKPDDGKK